MEQMLNPSHGTIALEKSSGTGMPQLLKDCDYRHQIVLAHFSENGLNPSLDPTFFAVFDISENQMLYVVRGKLGFFFTRFL